MKIIILAILLLNSAILAQRDTTKNTTFNSVALSIDTLRNFILMSNYYTIADNIDNPGSSVFVSENPDITEVIEFVRTRPSYHFIVLKGNYVIAMITVVPRLEGKKTVYSYLVLNPNNQHQIELPCEVEGDVTELRAAELLVQYKNESQQFHAGPLSMILFSDTAYSIQPYEALKKDVIQLINKTELYKDQGTGDN